MNKPEISADLDTINDRLTAANEALDAQLDRALGPLPLKQVLQLAPEVARRLDPAARARATETIEQQLSRLPAAASQSWDELRRPSLSQLQNNFRNRRLMRA